MSKEALLTKVYLASIKGISRAISSIVPPHEIEDIVQETYVRICQVKNKDDIISPKSFMYKTAKNLALDYKKQASVRLIDGGTEVDSFSLNGSNLNVDEMYQRALTNNEFEFFCEAVRHLPIQCRKVFVLKKVYGYSQREISKELKISESTVEKHISAGMKSCVKYMRSSQQPPSSEQTVVNASKIRGGKGE
ncbi:RNA polymerase sigma factor [Paraferrimonas sp. SM1919]|uniref:RNA polymerase sigma factor n=1 Tax=Paraferrimonas sp. SM1919 TaxID=2662263 RepID=UPI0013D4E797|nr:sigma-70 family RNA polymerase sigma factor [Paraferrimonas sp. SM1919]